MSLFRREFNSTFDYYKTQDEVCGTCKYNKRDWTKKRIVVRLYGMQICRHI